MRQTALITLMAQMGCFVPASYAKISVVDRIFTRVGASDDLTAGQSTFMVEMSEVANIIKNATSELLRNIYAVQKILAARRFLPLIIMSLSNLKISWKALRITA